MTPEECAAEALLRVKAADELFARIGNTDPDCNGDQCTAVDHRRMAHLRQTAQVYATLALTKPVGPVADALRKVDESTAG